MKFFTQVFCILLTCYYCSNQAAFGQVLSRKKQVTVANFVHQGDSLKRKKQYSKAIQSFQSASDIYLKAKYWEQALSIENKITECFFLSYQYDEGLIQALKANQHMAQKLEKKSISYAKNYYLIGQLYRKTGPQEKSIEYLSQSISILEKLGKPKHNIVGKAYYAWAFILRETSLKESLDHFYKALEILPSYATDIYESVGLVYSREGRYHQSLNYFQQSLKVRSKKYSKTHRKVRNSHTNLGVIYSNIGDFQQAKFNLFKALEIQKQVDSSEKALSPHYNRLGILYKKMHLYDSSIIYFNKALGTSLQKNNNPFIYYNKGVAKYYVEEFDSCLVYYRKAIVKANITPEDFTFFKADIYTSMANVYLNIKVNQLDSAVIYYQKAIDYFKYQMEALQKDGFSYQITKYLSMSTRGLAIAYAKLWKKDKNNSDYLNLALENFNASDSLFYSFRANRTSIYDKTELDNIGLLYENVLPFFIETNDKDFLELSFYIDERNKANVLQEAYSNNFIQLPDSLQQKKSQLQKQINYHLQILRDQNISSEIHASFRDSLFNARLTLDKFLLKNRKNTQIPGKHSWNQLKIKSISEIQALIDPETAIISYLIAENKLYIFGISKDDYQVISLPFQKDSLEKLLDKFLISINSWGADFPQIAHQLYEILLKPIHQITQFKKSLVIIPDKKLYQLPFDALLNNLPAENNQNPANLNYLINDYTISYYPSVSLAINTSQDQKHKAYTQDFIGFAPVFPEGNDNSSSRSTQKSTIKDNSDRKLSLLAASERELKQIDSLFNHHKQLSTIYLFEEAKEERLKLKPLNTRFLHMSTHGFAHDEKPELSWLAFHQPASEEYYAQINKGIQLTMEDGILFQDEIADLNLNVDIMVLASCESGVGKIVNGEGVLSFYWALMYQGVPRLVYSLWRINDKATAQLMTYFYQYYLESQCSYAEALRKAKIAMIQDTNPEKAYFLPYNWSGIQLMSPNLSY